MRMLESDHWWSGFDIRYPSGRGLTKRCQIQNSTRGLYLLVVLDSNIRKGARRNGMRMLESDPYLASRRLRARHLPVPRTHAHIYAASGFRAEGRCRLAESKARQEKYAAGLPAVWLCRHRQDHAGTPHCRGRRWRGEV